MSVLYTYLVPLAEIPHAHHIPVLCEGVACPCFLSMISALRVLRHRYFPLNILLAADKPLRAILRDT